MPFTFKLSMRLALMTASLVPGSTLPESAAVSVTSPRTLKLDSQPERQLREFYRHPSHADRCHRRLTMTFKHKLSRRLALMRNVVLLGGLVTLAGCDLRKLMGLLEGVVVTVSVYPTAPSITAGRTVQLTATPRDGSGNALTWRVVSWSKDNGAVATVNASGLVTGAAAGAATVTAMSEGLIGTAAVTVAPANVAVASVTVSPAPASVTVGQTAQLTATPKDASGNPLAGRVVTWSSSNTSVATVNGSGLVTGVAAGPA